ncbi:KdsC family phosphatase [Novipirellula artificiosorum]|uniref:3-deoxy-D-manno-octulosonate 8-phosphate phosphatase KdsC n=1 Tax=Novipirellula artificiosorum TaxID=2528016 RepID=A0A5C6DND3_9BACT|nr:HAD hydrolase family protein [Novipirellula artificiosorum]TWU37171.1 3-deoxy-D-manno-octulosonate 8-phosphate phosphatase KdsC [Novipirellula artificiosorum]
MPERLTSDAEAAAPITCILSDVDGVLTDGRIIYSDTGMEIKQFHARDGLGIKLWMTSGFTFGILTARTGNAVVQRAADLGITHVMQGFEDKWPAAQEMLGAIGCSADQVCYVGDDLPDIPVMRQVGLAVAPADAASDARDAAHWVLRSGGGRGAVREAIERLLRAKNRWHEHLKTEHGS